MLAILPKQFVSCRGTGAAIHHLCGPGKSEKSSWVLLLCISRVFHVSLVTDSLLPCHMSHWQHPRLFWFLFSWFIPWCDLSNKTRWRTASKEKASTTMRSLIRLTKSHNSAAFPSSGKILAKIFICSRFLFLFFFINFWWVVLGNCFGLNLIQLFKLSNGNVTERRTH